MKVISGISAHELYSFELGELITQGVPVDVRGRKTIELLDVATVIKEPQHHCILLPARRWNPWLAMSEFLWILAGREDVAAVQPYNKRIVDFSDNGRTLYGAYGSRIYNQIDPLIERLKKDPSDRRAVITIWREYDLTADTKDPPCNDMILFKLRNNQLHMTVINRSNDIHWGLYAVNLPTFSLLQEYIASRLGVEMGDQTHMSNSLHYYTDQKEAVDITNRMISPDNTWWKIPYPSHAKAFNAGELSDENHHWWAGIASDILDGANIGTGHPLFFYFAATFLEAYKRRDLTGLHKFPEFADWNKAAKNWQEEVWKK